MTNGDAERLFDVLPVCADPRRGVYVLHPPGWFVAAAMAVVGSSLAVALACQLRSNLIDLLIAVGSLMVFTALLSGAILWSSGPKLVLTPTAARLGYFRCDHVVFVDHIARFMSIPRPALFGLCSRWRVVIESTPAWPGAPTHVLAIVHAGVTDLGLGRLWLRRLSHVVSWQCGVRFVALGQQPLVRNEL